VGILPAFYTRVYALRYGEDAMEVYHDRSECLRGQKILEDHNERFGQEGRRRCAKCGLAGWAGKVVRRMPSSN
jgi:hypothetical protein